MTRIGGDRIRAVRRGFRLVGDSQLVALTRLAEPVLTIALVPHESCSASGERPVHRRPQEASRVQARRELRQR